MFQKHYSEFLKYNSHIQHFACHSHHYWPDVTRNAVLEYWDDSAKYVDDKWEFFFTHKIPQAQSHIARELKLSNPSNIVFAPNTHEFVYRLLSSLDRSKKNKILTTDSEFHSFDRQVNRLIESELFECDFISTQPFDNFTERFISQIKKSHYDMIFLSSVFFNSGMAIKDLNEIVRAVKNDDTMIIIDGYHAFMALPLDLSAIEDRIFFIAGSYKYAQGGEGCCFMYVPEYATKKFRPEYTGWFSELEKIGEHDKTVFYPDSALRFAGSTMDFSALYRLNAAFKLFMGLGLDSKKIHEYVQTLQKSFLAELTKQDHHYLTEKNILAVDYNYHGHFFTFALPSPEHARDIHQKLKAQNIITDYRGSRLRFGFGLYQTVDFDLSALKNL